MNNTMINSIMKDAANMEEADNLMTESLVALEKCDWEAAYNKSMATLGISQNIEQRIAAIMVRELATAMDATAVVAILDEAYSTDDPCEATVEAYKADRLKVSQDAYDKLNKSVDAFVSSLKRARDRLTQEG